MIDLHTHSNYSDGTLTPTEIIEKAEKLSLKAIAITDHDTANGLNEGIDAAKNKNTIFIPGIELSVAHKPGELHILGLSLKQWDSSPLLDSISSSRTKRNRSIIRLMNEQGLDIKYEDLKKLTKGTIGRPHFAVWLKSKGYVKTINEAFSRYLVWGKPFYLPRKTTSLPEALDFIHSCGGKAFIAHPMNIPVNFTTLKDKMGKWLDSGVDGIEVVHTGARRNMTKRLIEFAQERGCLITGGSDFHGENKPKIKMGKTTEYGNIDDKFLPDLF